MRVYIHQKGFYSKSVKENAGQILDVCRDCESEGYGLCIFPELVTCGYFANDLLLYDEYVESILEANKRIISASGNMIIVFGTVTVFGKFHKEAFDVNLLNSAVVAQNGRIVSLFHKCTLACGGVFDEYRYFLSARELSNRLFNLISTEGCFVDSPLEKCHLKNVVSPSCVASQVGVVICRDTWKTDVAEELSNIGYKLIVSINASPFEVGKLNMRKKVVLKIAESTSLPVLYCNQVLVSDGTVLDGGSFAVNSARGSLHEDRRATIVQFSNQFDDRGVSSELEFCDGSWNILQMEEGVSSSYDEYDKAISSFGDEIANIYRTNVLTLREYFLRGGFNSITVGLSGGVDSALVALIAGDAIGFDKLNLIFLPSRFSSKESFDNVENFAKGLGVVPSVIFIQERVDEMFKSSLEFFQEGREALGDSCEVAYQNIQARVRGNILMTISNIDSSLLLSTGNKSELMTGYCTMYGDTCGGFNPIKDLYKTEVFEICKWRNSLSQEAVKENDLMGTSGEDIIPNAIIDRLPTAELSDNQLDSDSLPEYCELDEILRQYLDQKLPVSKIKENFSSKTVERVIELIRKSEWKRKQSAIGPMILSSGLSEYCRRFSTFI